MTLSKIIESLFGLPLSMYENLSYIRGKGGQDQWFWDDKTKFIQLKVFMDPDNSTSK